ncbi:inosine triphosphate pyrophosphatase-like [Physella acuta]|uniref:inosine triphosphate pyrophosphatase-like n=1 Tax=Physella acuta TaxID=109671 RepID=UPI0027DDCA7E|nr:inosine triphosphate pyrophosphatase-like [Physella acuta]
MIKRMSKPIVLCTGNKNKLKEIIEILGKDFPYKIENQDIDLPEYQGEPEEIATAKCELAAERVKGPVIVEDVSLCFNALNGMPGPYIKWFLAKMGPSGLHRMLKSYDDKSGYAQCVFAYSSGEKGSKVHIFDGRCNGTIVEPRGSTEFGWDPIFQPDGYKETYAEMDKKIKNGISHRSKAIMMLKDFLLQLKSGK